MLCSFYQRQPHLVGGVNIFARKISQQTKRHLTRRHLTNDQLDANDMDSRQIEEKIGDIKEVLSEKTEKVTEGINKLHSKMTTNGTQYPAPRVPDTPSPTINRTLKNKFDKKFNNPVKYAVAWIICFLFTTIVKIYNLLHKEEKSSQKMWTVACAIVSVLSVVVAFIAYYVVLACTYILHVLLFYACILMAFGGVGIAASGAVFFDKDKHKQTPKVNKVQ